MPRSGIVSRNLARVGAAVCRAAPNRIPLPCSPFWLLFADEDILVLEDVEAIRQRTVAP